MKANYDIVVIGFGKAGKTLAAKFSKAGKSVALVEKDKNMYGQMHQKLQVESLRKKHSTIRRRLLKRRNS